MENFQKDLSQLEELIKKEVSEFIKKYPVQNIYIDTPTIDITDNFAEDYILGRVSVQVVLYNKKNN